MSLPTIGTCTPAFGTKIEGDPAKLAEIEARVKKTIEDHDLISPDDTVVVAVSGGKDSTVLLSLLHKFGYDVKAITVNSHIGCYSEESLQRTREMCDSLGVKLYVAGFRENYGSSVCYITDVLQNDGQKLGTCTVCGVLRRKLINKAARELGATKIALGHNMDDEVQAYLMNLFRNRTSLNARMGPKPGLVQDDAFVQRIKPLYFVSEEDIKYYSQSQGFPVNYGECPCSVKSFRYAIKQFIKAAKTDYPEFCENTLKYALDTLPKTKEKVSRAQGHSAPGKCTVCGEPTSNTMCRSCDIIEKFKIASQSQQE